MCNRAIMILILTLILATIFSLILALIFAVNTSIKMPFKAGGSAKAREIAQTMFNFILLFYSKCIIIYFI